MNFEEFQNQSRLYVIGALESEEMEEFERERKKFGKKAEDFITQCYVLHEGFALSVRPAKASAAIKEQLMSMVRERKQVILAPEMQRVFLCLRPLNNADRIDHAAHRKRESRQHVSGCETLRS
jgi:hypothetical protein